MPNTAYGTSNTLNIHRSGFQFFATEQNLVFEFFNQFYRGFRGANGSYTETFFIIKQFLIGKAKILYNIVVLFDITSISAAGCFPDKKLLGTLQIDENINEAVSVLQVVRISRTKTKTNTSLVLSRYPLRAAFTLGRQMYNSSTQHRNGMVNLLLYVKQTSR